MSEQIRTWLLDRGCMNLRCIEKEAEIPVKTLDHLVHGRRSLTALHIDRLVPVLTKYGYDPNEHR